MKIALSKIGILCGLLAPILWASVIVLCGSLRPELGERGSSTEFIMRYAGFVPTGLMQVAFSAFLYFAFRGSRLATVAASLLALNGLARIVAGMFPCEPGCALPRLLINQKLHSLSAGVGFCAFIGGVILWGVLFRRYESLRCLSLYSICSGFLALVFLALMSWSAEMRASTGLYERFSSGILSLWVLVFAARLWRLRTFTAAGCWLKPACT
jgi:hypothetical protein